jgi:hypothetical protein
MASAFGQLHELLVVSGLAHQAGPGGLAEGEAEAQERGRAGERLVEILDGLDEMRLAEDHVQLPWLLDPHGDQLHSPLPPVSRPAPAPGDGETVPGRPRGGRDGARRPAADAPDGVRSGRLSR